MQATRKYIQKRRIVMYNGEIHVIGCGGIGSYLAEHLDKMKKLKQIHNAITFYDDDTVSMKNLKYQNFRVKDVDVPKTEALKTRLLNIDFINKRISKPLNISTKALIVICADNNEIRRTVFESGINFIDARANGRSVGLFSIKTHGYLSTVSEDNSPKSCQHDFQINKGEIEYGNIIVAAMLTQAVLSYCRNEKFPFDSIITFA
jgi:molybdopterin/thiamine biosynthesis adenylyltransferase